MMDGITGAVRKRADGRADKRALAGELTREKMLDAAEQLFAERGPDGASVRDIASAAGVDLAMINYHFGSKHELYRAVFRRRSASLNSLRLAALDEALRRWSGHPPLRAIVEALVAPNVRLRLHPELGGIDFARMIVREMIDAKERERGIIEESFDDLAERFVAALAALYPTSTRPDLVWAFHFAINTMVQSMVSNARVIQLLNDETAADDPDEVLRRLTSFITAGIMASV